jgi:adenosylhomocysteine nucleosidase
MALPMENVDGVLNAFGEVIYTGVGKVNATMALTRRLTQGPLPELVLNLGSAGAHQRPTGAHQRPTGAIVACTQFIEHDMDATALGFHWGQTPFEDAIEIDSPLPPEWQQLNLPEAVCHSGDRFVTEPHAFFEFDVVDMEGYALAKVCQAFNVPFVSLKFITDGADGQAATDWPEALAQASRGLAAVLARIN